MVNYDYVEFQITLPCLYHNSERESYLPLFIRLILETKRTETMEILVVTEILDIAHVPRLKNTRDNSEANVPLSSGGTTREHAMTLA